MLDLWEAFSLTIGRELRIAARGVMDETIRNALKQAMAGIRAARNQGASIEFFHALHELHAVARSCVTNQFITPPQLLRLAEFWLPYVQQSIPLAIYLDRYVDNYQRITGALVAGDGATAESAFHYHARWSAAIIRGERPDPDGPWVA